MQFLAQKKDNRDYYRDRIEKVYQMLQQPEGFTLVAHKTEPVGYSGVQKDTYGFTAPSEYMKKITHLTPIWFTDDIAAMANQTRIIYHEWARLVAWNDFDQTNLDNKSGKDDLLKWV